MNSKPSSSPSGSIPNSRSAPKLEHHIQVRLSAEEAAGTEGQLSSWFGPARTTRTMATIQCRATLTTAGSATHLDREAAPEEVQGSVKDGGRQGRSLRCAHRSFRACSTETMS
jgi:hypothetical protein